MVLNQYGFYDLTKPYNEHHICVYILYMAEKCKK
jgi:hypothetical protein